MENDLGLRVENLLSNTLDELFTLAHSDNWESLGNKNNVAGFQKSIGESVNVIKAVGIINFRPEEVASFIMDNSYKWDETLEESKVLHQLRDDLLVMYERYKCPWPVSNRDFVYGLKVVSRDDGVFILVKSIDVPSPVIKGVVRGEIIISGYLLKRSENGNTECTYLVCIDPKGSIPKMIVRQINKDQVSNISAIRDFMTSIRSKLPKT